MVGMHPIDALKSPYISFFPSKIQRNPNIIRLYLGVASEIEKVSGGYFGAGCWPHSCTIEEGAWFISEDGKTSVAIIMTNPTYSMNDPSFEIYGSSYSDLPKPLAMWGGARGMNDRNTSRRQ
jgi:hypothetical protein